MYITPIIIAEEQTFSQEVVSSVPSLVGDEKLEIG